MPSKKILIVDDQPLVLTAIARYLEQRGYDMTLAANGQEGLQEAERVAPDLIITDIRMPIIDGWEFVRTLRSRAEFALTPVIILTDDGETESRMQGYRIGADDFVSKTTIVDELEVRVARALERAEQIQAAAVGVETAVGRPAKLPPIQQPTLVAPVGGGGAAAEVLEEDQDLSDPESSLHLDLPPLVEAVGRPTPPCEADEPDLLDTPEIDGGSGGEMRGSLDQIGLASMLSILCSGAKSGIFSLRTQDGSEQGRMLLRDGQVLKVRVDSAPQFGSVEAVACMMKWEAPTFTFSHQDVTARDEVQASSEHLLMQASQVADEGHL